MPRRVLLILLTAAVVAGCSSGDQQAEPQTTAATPSSRVPTQETTPAVEAVVKVIDGDTNRAVPTAVVRLREATGRANRRGVARMEMAEGGFARARLSAPGYIARRVLVRFPTETPYVVRIWWRAVQWPMYGATPARTQAHPAIGLRPPFRVVWHRQLRKLLEFPAVVWEGVAYVSQINGWVTALSMRSGRVLWKKRVGTKIASSPAVDAARGQLVVTTKEPGHVSLVAMETGKIRWRYNTAQAEPSPVIVRGIAYFGDEGGRVYALDLQRRKMRWVVGGAAKITSSPAVVGRRLYVGDYAGRVYALDARSGRRVWTGSAGTRVYGTVAVAGGRVFAPSVFSGLSALSARTGRLLWRIPAGGYLYSSPAYYRGRVYFGTYARVLYSASARSGRILWRRPAGGRVSGAVQVVAGVVYAANLEDSMAAWNWRSGRRVWSFPHGEYVPISGNGARLLLHGAHDIWAVEPKRRR